MNETKEFEFTVVAKILGKDVTQGELSKAFDKVASFNWKDPINTTIDVSDDFELLCIARAVTFFTGSVAKFDIKKGGKLPGCRYKVTASGYYATIGA